MIALYIIATLLGEEGHVTEVYLSSTIMRVYFLVYTLSYNYSDLVALAPLFTVESVATIYNT